jgi:hypothetical protein
VSRIDALVELGTMYAALGLFAAGMPLDEVIARTSTPEFRRGARRIAELVMKTL